MNAVYPNLPLLEEKFKHAIQNKLIAATHAMYTEQTEDGRIPYFVPSYTVDVFLQTFPNTAGLLSRRGTLSGQAFTDYYVTVIHEALSDLYGVFQGNKLIYTVSDVPEEFFQDVNARSMATVEEAQVRYIKKCSQDRQEDSQDSKEDSHMFHLNDNVSNAWGTCGMVVGIINQDTLDVVWLNKESNRYIREIWNVTEDRVKVVSKK